MIARPAAMLAGVLFAMSPVTGHAEPTETDYARINAAIATGHAAPRYALLAEAAQGFETSVNKLCQAPAPRDLSHARDAFGAALNAYMGIEHIQHGPVELFMRRFRLHYWPDKGSRGARQLRVLLAKRDKAILAPDHFARSSVALQGFPVAERLLFGADEAKTVAAAADGDYPCHLLMAVAHNIAAMATAMRTDWTPGTNGSYVDEIRAAGSKNARFANHKAATADFVKGIHTELELMVDTKLDRVVGRKTGTPRPHRAETWRSGHALGNIIANLTAMRAMYEGEGGPGLKALLGPGNAERAALLSKAFDQTLATAKSIRLPLAKAVVDPKARPVVERLALEARALKVLISGELAPALGTPLGFNALDGD